MTTCLFTGTMSALRAETTEPITTPEGILESITGVNDIEESTVFDPIDLENITPQPEDELEPQGYICNNHIWSDPEPQYNIFGFLKDTHKYHCTVRDCTSTYTESHTIDYRTFCYQSDICERCYAETDGPMDCYSANNAIGRCCPWDENEHYYFCGRRHGDRSCIAKVKWENHYYDGVSSHCVACSYFPD